MFEIVTKSSRVPQNITLRITGGKKQSDEGAALFAVRVNAIVCARHGHDLMGCKSPVHYPERYSI